MVHSLVRCASNLFVRLFFMFSCLQFMLLFLLSLLLYVVAASWLFVCMWDRWFQLHVWLLACVNVCL